MWTKIKKENGFTIMESIISIFALSVISIFVLKMFLLASQVNVIAKENDKGLTLATNAIEVIKSKNSPQDIFDDGFFADAVVLKEDYYTDLYLCYDKNFLPVSASISSIENIKDLFENNPETAYILKVSFAYEDIFSDITQNEMIPEELQEDILHKNTLSIPMSIGTATGQTYLNAGLYQIQAVMAKLSDDEPANFLSLEGKKYFVYIDSK